jgi:hypothetical protein
MTNEPMTNGSRETAGFIPAEYQPAKPEPPGSARGMSQ